MHRGPFRLPSREESLHARCHPAEAPRQGRTARAPPAPGAEAHAPRASRSPAGDGALYRGAGVGPASTSCAYARGCVCADDQVPAAAPQRPAAVRAGGAGRRGPRPAPAVAPGAGVAARVVRPGPRTSAFPPGGAEAHGRGRGGWTAARCPRSTAPAGGGTGLRAPPAGRRGRNPGGLQSRGVHLSRVADEAARVPGRDSVHHHSGRHRRLLSPAHRNVGPRFRDADDADRAPDAGARAAAEAGAGDLRDARPPDTQTAPPREGRRRLFSRYRGRLQLHDVLSGGALLPLNHLELDPLAFGQGLEAILLDRGVMHEAVLFAVLGRDEAEALRVVEPLHGTGDACHTGDTPDLMFTTARGFRLAACRGLVLPPSLSGPALVEALALQILEQTGPRNLPAELLQDPVQSVVLAQRDLHRPRSRREAHRKPKRTPGEPPG